MGDADDASEASPLAGSKFSRMSIRAASTMFSEYATDLAAPAEPYYALEVPENGYKIIQYTNLPADHVYAQKAEVASRPTSPVKRLINKTKGLFMSPSKKQRQRAVESDAPMSATAVDMLGVDLSTSLDNIVAPFPDPQTAGTDNTTSPLGQGSTDQADLEKATEDLKLAEPERKVSNASESKPTQVEEPKSNFEGGIRLITRQPAPADMDDAIVPQRDLGPGLFEDDDKACAILVRGVPNVERVQPSNKYPRLNPNGPVLSEHGKEVYRKELENVSGGRLLTFKKSCVDKEQRAKTLSMIKKLDDAKQVVRKTNKWFFAGRFLDLTNLPSTVGVATTRDLPQSAAPGVHNRHAATGLPLRTLSDFAKENLTDEAALLPALRTFLAFVHTHIFGDCPSLDAYEIQIHCIKARKDSNTKATDKADEPYHDDFPHWTRDEQHPAPLRIATSLVGDGLLFQKNLALAVETLEDGEPVQPGGRADMSREEKKLLAKMMDGDETEQVGKNELAFWYARPHERAAVYAVAPKGDGAERVEAVLRVGEEAKLKGLSSWKPAPPRDITQRSYRTAAGRA